MITSLQNDKVKRIKQLQIDSHYRKSEGVYCVESVKIFNEAPLESIESVYCTQTQLDNPTLKLQQLGPEKCILVSDQVYAKMSSDKSPQGLLAVIKMQYRTIDSFSDKQRIIVLDQLQDPGNLGTIIRTLDATGGGALLLSDQCVDIYHPKVVKATMGAIFRVPFMIQVNLNEMIPMLHQMGFITYATTLTKDSKTLYTYPFSQKDAFIIGNEGHGIRKEIIQLAQHQLFIPMDGNAESLNAGVAASIIVYEHYRQNVMSQ